MLPMLDTRHDRSLGRTVARELIRNQHARRDALSPEQLARRRLVAFVSRWLWTRISSTVIFDYTDGGS